MRTVHSTLFLLCAVLFSAPTTALAHFGVLVPDKNIVGKGDDKTVLLDVRFWHPMDDVGMDLEKPFLELYHKGKEYGLSESLAEKTVAGKKTWTASAPIKGPGAHTFLMVPPPYFEPTEDTFIQHLSKTVVGALGDDEGWDKPVGAQVEIVPLTRPYGLYAPGFFSGRLFVKGKPRGGAEVEVEYFNPGGALKAPTDPHTTMVVKTDPQGVFGFTVPWEGWWGFSALTIDSAKMKRDGKDKPLELGAVLWIYAHPPLKR